MADLRTTFMGLSLKNPIIVASGPLTANIADLVRCEEAGAGAVVLKSIFEQQIDYVAGKDSESNSEFVGYSDFNDAYKTLSKDYYINQYLELLAEAKQKLSIPVISSINCTRIKTWEDFAKRFEQVGADAIELNYYPLASDSSVPGEKVDREAIAFARTARRAIKVPVALKTGFEYSSISSIMKSFEKEGINGLVLFNHFFRPDIDIDKEDVCGGQATSNPTEYLESLRWIALLAGEMKKADLAAATGIHNGETVIKMLLAGAKAVEINSILMKNGLEAIGTIICRIEKWMGDKGYKSVSEFCGKLSQERMPDGEYWERTQFMRTLRRS